MSEDKAKTNTAACCSKRAAGDSVKPGWLPGSALLLQLEEKLLALPKLMPVMCRVSY